MWSEKPSEWKRCLDTFCKRMRRAYSDASGIWKLEPQERGAPHYHLLVFGVDFIPHQVLSQWWFEIVGSGDERHLQAGISIEAVRSREGVMHYASKMYMGKIVQGFSGVGRFWGVFNRGKLPLSKAVRVEIAQPVLVHFQRIARRFIQSQMKTSFLWKRAIGKRVRWRRYRCGTPSRVLAGDSVQWLRVGEWAEGELDSEQRATRFKNLVPVRSSSPKIRSADFDFREIEHSVTNQEMNRISALAFRLAVISFILLVWAYILISHPHQNLIVNGRSEGDISVNHPKALLASTFFSLVGGLALAGSAVYLQFRLKPGDATLGSSAPGFNWRGVILLGIALLFILWAAISDLLNHLLHH